MSEVRLRPLLALALSLGVHAGLLAVWAVDPQPDVTPTASAPLQIDLTRVPVEAEPAALERPAKPRVAMPAPSHASDPDPIPVTASVPPAPVPEKALAAMPAPPAPSAEEWALASTYTLKNSKRYRYNWGQLVRSMMGTATEGVQQGLVRFRVEIAPNGKLAKAEVLWSTSDVVEKLALQAIGAMPALPPTPTGKPLVFEKTIAFLPFETGWPPIYKYDCMPDPQSFKNPFAWNGSSPRPTSQAHSANASPPESASDTECPDSGSDSIEAEEKDMERQFKEWGSARLNGAE